MPSKRAAALMRNCHKRRNERFLFRRSRYAWVPAFKTAVCASFIFDLRPHMYPLVFLRRLVRRLTWCVPRFTRGIRYLELLDEVQQKIKKIRRKEEELSMLWHERPKD